MIQMEWVLVGNITMTKLVFDYDFIVFKAACAVENRFVNVTNKKTNKELIFKNRTEVYGASRKRDGGWLAEQEGLTLDDILIEDQREVEPLANALKVAKTIIEGTCELLNAESYYGYVSGRGNFRKEICTLLPYKGNREGMISPYYRDDVTKYLVDNHNAILTANQEPDDALTTDMYSAIKNSKDLIGVTNEKDYYGCDGKWWHYDLNKLVDIHGFGHLERNSKGVVKGQGRLWKYFQVCWADNSDNYDAACFSDKRNGQVGVFNKLKDCKNDLEAFTAMKYHFQFLYPTPKVITNWRGDNIEIDWLYVMQECFNMAHLLRWENDRVDVKKVLETFEIYP